MARKLDAVTVIDIVRARYGSNALANISAIIVVLFFAATMVAQFVGGAKLFEAVTGYSYLVGLVLFGAAVILFTTIGGFRGVAFTDALCGIIMLVGIFVLAGGILVAGGGYENIMDTIEANHPAMLEPFSGGSMPAGLYFTQWLLVGILTFVLPQSMVRCMGFKDTKALHGAMITGTVIIGLMMIGVTSLGVLSAGVLTGSLADYGASVDNIIPQAIAQTLPAACRRGHHRPHRRVHLHGVVAAHCLVVGHHQGRVPAFVRTARQAALRARHRARFAAGHACGGRHRVRSGRRAARRHLEDQHVRVRRPGDGVFLGDGVRPVLASRRQAGRAAFHGGRHCICARAAAVGFGPFGLHRDVIGIVVMARS